VFDRVTIAYRGAKYEIGRGRGFYGVWTTGAPRSEPLDRWPETSEGWSAAWTRFVSIEAPGTIGPMGRHTPPVGTATAASTATASTATASTATAASTATGLSAAPRTGLARSGRAGALASAALLGVGVILGVAGLFPAYLGGASLAQQADQLIPHGVYLAVWTVSAVLILLGGTRLRIGALLGLGLSLVTFGLFLADAGTAITGVGNASGAGLVLCLLGWLACAAGSVMAFLLYPAEQPDALARPRGPELAPVMMLVLAGLGVAAAFAPAWDSFTLRTAAGQSHSLTAGNAFSNPGLVIAGDLAVMLALAAVVVVAAFWRPIRHGGVLLAAATIPMAAQAVSALVQVGQGASSAQFGISSAQASQIGLTISSGLTPAFWIYCGFLVVLLVSCAWMIFTSRPAPAPYPAAGGAYGRADAAYGDLAGEDRDDEESDDEVPDHEGRDNEETDDAVTPVFETARSRARAVGDAGGTAA
jgi:hypothetical protein